MAIKNPWPNIKDLEFNDNTTLSSSLINAAFEFVKGQEVVKTVDGPSVEFKNCNTDPFIEVNCNINPVQSGSGNPSPDNIRPISGFSTVNVHNDDTVYPVALGQTVYGSEVDITSGEGTITHNLDTFNGDSITSLGSSGGVPYVRVVASSDSTGIRPDMISNQYVSSSVGQSGNISWISASQRVVYIYDNRFTDLDTAKALLNANPVTLYYPLATPTNFTFTPAAINSKEGVNTVYHDANGDITVKYKTTIRCLMNQ